MITSLITFLQSQEYKRRARAHFKANRAVLESFAEFEEVLYPPYVPVVDTAQYSVRREGTMGGWVYAPWDWSQAKSIFLANIAKATQGNFTDPFYDEQVGTLTRANIMFASYSFFDPLVNPVDAATNFCHYIEYCGGYGMFVVVDCEVKPSSVSNVSYMRALNTFVEETKRLMYQAGIASPKIVIYSRASFWNPIWVGAGSPTWPLQLPQWVAQYPYDGMTDANYRAVCRSILYAGYVPPMPTAMMGLGPLWGYQWTAKVPNDMIPGHNMVKKVEDGNLWLSSSLVPMDDIGTQPSPPEGSLQYEVLVSNLNVRTGPGTNYGVLGTLNMGEVVTALDVGGTNSWVKISNDPEKWVAKQVNSTVFLKKKP